MAPPLEALELLLPVLELAQELAPALEQESAPDQGSPQGVLERFQAVLELAQAQVQVEALALALALEEVLELVLELALAQEQEELALGLALVGQLAQEQEAQELAPDLGEAELALRLLLSYRLWLD